MFFRSLVSQEFFVNVSSFLLNVMLSFLKQFQVFKFFQATQWFQTFIPELNEKSFLFDKSGGKVDLFCDLFCIFVKVSDMRY